MCNFLYTSQYPVKKTGEVLLSTTVWPSFMVVCHRARRLFIADADGLQDPYVRVQLANAHRGVSGAQNRETDVHMDGGSAPVWTNGMLSFNFSPLANSSGKPPPMDAHMLSIDGTWHRRFGYVPAQVFRLHFHALAFSFFLRQWNFSELPVTSHINTVGDYDAEAMAHGAYIGRLTMPLAHLLSTPRGAVEWFPLKRDDGSYAGDIALSTQGLQYVLQRMSRHFVWRAYT
jgi:hypothetical protein